MSQIAPLSPMRLFPGKFPFASKVFISLGCFTLKTPCCTLNYISVWNNFNKNKLLLYSLVGRSIHFHIYTKFAVNYLWYYLFHYIIHCHANWYKYNKTGQQKVISFSTVATYNYSKMKVRNDQLKFEINAIIITIVNVSVLHCRRIDCRRCR